MSAKFRTQLESIQEEHGATTLKFSNGVVASGNVEFYPEDHPMETLDP